MSEGFRPASLSALRQGSIERSTRSAMSDSNFARLMVCCRCFGPEASAVMKGRLMSVEVPLESSIFAFSQASFRR